MELSLEAYRIIVNNVRSRVDLATLCLVSKGFRRVAERALYNTLFMHETERTERICKTLVGQPRVAELVEALTIAIEELGEERRGEEGEAPGEEDEEEGGGGGDDDDEATDTEENEAQSDDQDESMELAAALALSLETSQHAKVPTTSSSARRARPETEETLWPAISNALKKMSRLRHLSIVIDGSFSSPYSGRLAWILADCPFRLKSFHSDMRWDENLVRFLNVQDEIEDLYIGDYDEGEEGPGEVEESTGLDEKTPVTTRPSGPVGPRASHNSLLTLSPTALPHLYTLECTFSEAAIAIVPGRPVSRLKTCFSRTDPEGKRAEMKVLFEGLGKALVPAKNRSSARGGRAAQAQEGLTGGGGRGGWYALDIADAEYEEGFARDLLRAVVNLTLVRSGSGGHGRAAGATKSTGSLNMKGTLRYLGTLVLPVGGREVSHNWFNG